MKHNIARPSVIVYELNREKYAPFSHQFKFTFFKPSMYRIPETKFDYFVTNNEHIRNSYNELNFAGGKQFKELVFEDGEVRVVEVGVEIKKKKAEEVPTPLKEESEATLPEAEDNASQDSTEAPIEEEQAESDEFSELSWFELRAKASEAGLEGRFSKDEALEFLRNQ